MSGRRIWRCLAPRAALAGLVGALLGACVEPPACESFAPVAGRGNHIQPFEIAVDTANRTAFSTSLSTRTVGRYDLDTRQMIGAVPVAEKPLVFPDVAVDEFGTAWVVSYGIPPVIRIGALTNDRSHPETSIALARRVVAVPGGGAVVLGEDEEHDHALARFEPDGTEAATQKLGLAGLGLLALDDGLGVLHAGLEAEALGVLSWDDLGTLRACDLPFVATHGAQLDDGTLVVSSLERIGLAGCDGASPVDWEVGIENHDVISLGDSALVLDRIGPTNPNLGVARFVDRDGVDESRTFDTARNTGFGALDEDTGQVWANSEGTAEVVVLSPVDGTVEDTIRTGTHADGIAFDRSEEGVLYVTGRLSNTVLRIEDFALAEESVEVPWPFSPVTDFQRRTVWVLSQSDAAVYGLDMQTLQTVAVFDLEPAHNGLLTFGSLVMHPDDGTLFVAETAQDRLYQLDPNDGEILASWDLGGPPVLDPDVVGHLQVFVDPDHGALVLCRSNQGRVQRLDTVTGDLTTAWLDDVQTVTGTGNAVDFATLLRNQRLLYVGGVAVDADTLERREDRDLEVFRVVGPHPTEEGTLIAVDHGRHNLLHLGEDGETLGTLQFSDSDANASLFRIDPWRERALLVRSADARLCSFPVQHIR